MIYTEIAKKRGIIVIDGYSNKKTTRGAYNDLMREVAKIIPSEVISYGDNKEGINLANPDGYEIYITEVGCASTYNEDKEQMEYKEANYYCFIRVIE